MACCLHALHKDGDGIIGYEMGITYLCYAKDAVETKFLEGEG
jgi:hypothetical protein